MTVRLPARRLALALTASASLFSLGACTTAETVAQAPDITVPAPAPTPAPAAAGTVNVLIPGEGILCRTNITATTAASTTIVVFYG